MSEHWIARWLLASDSECGPACMNVPVPPTIAMDDDFREPYVQVYRHALRDVRSALATLQPERAALVERLLAAASQLEQTQQDWQSLVEIPTLVAQQQNTIDALREAAAAITGEPKER